MKRSIDRIRTTHTGSLPRPDDLVDLLYAEESGEAVDAGALQQRVRRPSPRASASRSQPGIDIVNDGEMGKVWYSTYVTARLTGFEGAASTSRAGRGRTRPPSRATPSGTRGSSRARRASSATRARAGPYVGHARRRSATSPTSRRRSAAVASRPKRS